jgi:anthranilate phosphoribosyltransferase
MSDEFQAILAKLTSQEHLTRAEARAAILFICSGSATPEQIRQLLLHLSYKRTSVDELVGAAAAMRELVIPIPAGGDVLDTCGTGGDVRHTFNISTAAAIIAASSGIKIVKHGNRSASGKAGSADVLEKLGVGLELPPARLVECLESSNICFAFARAFHPAMRHVAAARRELGIPTIFNVLGPLTNPGHAKLHLLGVFAPELTERLAMALRELGSRRAWIVHADDGLDEISTLGPTRVSELKDGQIQTWKLDPSDFGLSRAKLDDLQVRDVDEAAAALVGVLDGNAGPRRDIAVLNAGAALVIAEKAADLGSGMHIAEQAIDSGKSRQTLEDLVRLTKTHG